MTREEAIEVLKINIPHYGDDSAEWDLCLEAVDMAIRSLEAWDGLMKEMEKEINYYDEMPDIWYGISEAYGIIKKHLKEVEE